MNRNPLLAAALIAALPSAVVMAQTAPAPASTPAAAPAAPVAPQAIEAKVALIAFEQAVFSTNEGQQAVQTVQKKYEPKKAQIDQLSNEVDTLRKQAQAAPATATEEDKARRQREIDAKEKQLNRDAEDAQNSYNADLQEAYGKVAQKFSVTMKQYCQQNGFTLLLDVSAQQSPVMWALQQTDITAAAIDAYNKSSGVAAPPPSAPTASRPAGAAARPSTTPRRPQ